MLSIFNSNFLGLVCAFVEITHLDYFIFKANLLILSQSLIFDNSLFILNSILSANDQRIGWTIWAELK